jgi:hypothetical protein
MENCCLTRVILPVTFFFPIILFLKLVYYSDVFYLFLLIVVLTELLVLYLEIHFKLNTFLVMSLSNILFNSLAVKLKLETFTIEEEILYTENY